MSRSRDPESNAMEAILSYEIIAIAKNEITGHTLSTIQVDQVENMNMNTKIPWIILLVVFYLLPEALLSLPIGSPSIVEGVRLPAVAGVFYPENADTLRRWVEAFVQHARSPITASEIAGLVVPHAGYTYSGWVAGEAYRQIQGRSYDAVVIVGPSHYQYFHGASIFGGTAYQTPLGNVSVDTLLAGAIARTQPGIGFSDIGHRWDSSTREHSVEVQLPFLQVVLPGVPIVPIILGSQDFPTTDALMRAIVAGVHSTGERVLLVASSDLSHYHAIDTARDFDSALINAFGRYDYHLMEMRLFGRQWEACGGGPIVAMMMVAEQLGASRSVPLRYMNSADVPAGASRRDRVVGYMSALLVKGDTPLRLPILTRQESEALLKVARDIVTATVNGETPKRYVPLTRNLSSEYAAFVTLNKHGALRGCIGHVIPDGALLDVVQTVAPLSAVRDSRFKPVMPIELPDLEYEVTILSRFKRVLDTNEILVGRDGVYLRVGTVTSIFLPQVASEQRWNRRTLLEELGVKAGLAREAFLRSDAELYRFEACVVR